MRVALLITCAVIVSACAKSETRANNRDTMTQRQKDSVLGQSGLPGSRGVTQAMAAADSARARTARLDSIQ